mgnify:CR=1 FL=1
MASPSMMWLHRLNSLDGQLNGVLVGTASRYRFRLRLQWSLTNLTVGPSWSLNRLVYDEETLRQRAERRIEPWQLLSAWLSLLFVHVILTINKDVPEAAILDAIDRQFPGWPCRACGGSGAARSALDGGA